MYELTPHERLSLEFNKEAFYTNYRDAFSVLKAETSQEQERCYRLRYEVYCEENRYENLECCDDLEKDMYDDNAVHFLLIHNKSGKDAGTVRVILPDEASLKEDFPMQNLCNHPILHNKDRLHSFCQISRMCMHSDFRRRESDGGVLPAYSEQEDKHTAGHDGNMILIRRRIPYAPLGLFRAAFETALKHRITDCLMFIEPEQLSNFNRMGISYSALGPKVQHHGEQQPIVFNIKNVLDNMLIDNPGCWDIISDMGRIHKIANNLYLNDWQDHIMDDLDWDQILGQVS